MPAVAPPVCRTAPPLEADGHHCHAMRRPRTEQPSWSLCGSEQIIADAEIEQGIEEFCEQQGGNVRGEIHAAGLALLTRPSSHVVAEALPALLSGIHNPYVLEAGACEMVGDLAGAHQRVSRHRSLPHLRPQDIRGDEKASWLEHPERLTVEAVTCVEVKGRFHADNVVEGAVWELEARCVPEKESAARRELRRPLELFLRDVYGDNV